MSAAGSTRRQVKLATTQDQISAALQWDQSGPHRLIRSDRSFELFSSSLRPPPQIGPTHSLVVGPVFSNIMIRGAHCAAHHRELLGQC